MKTLLMILLIMASSVSFGQVPDNSYDGDGAKMGKWCLDQAQSLRSAVTILSQAHQCMWFSRYYSQSCLDKKVRGPLDGLVSESSSRYQELQGLSQKIPRMGSVKDVDAALATVTSELNGYTYDLLVRAKSYLIVDKIMNVAPRLGFGAKYIAYGLSYPELTQHVTVGVTLPQDCVRFQQNEYLIIPDLSKAFMAGGFSPAEEAQEPAYEKRIQSIVSNMRSGTATVDDLMTELKHQCRDR